MNGSTAVYLHLRNSQNVFLSFFSLVQSCGYRFCVETLINFFPVSRVADIKSQKHVKKPLSILVFLLYSKHQENDKFAWQKKRNPNGVLTNFFLYRCNPYRVVCIWHTKRNVKDFPSSKAHSIPYILSNKTKREKP